MAKWLREDMKHHKLMRIARAPWILRFPDRRRANRLMVELPFAGLRVLVIEDEYLLATDLKRLLLGAGAADVRLSGDLLDGAREVVADGYAFVLMDLNLRGDFAYPLADILARRGVPFGFVTGFDRKHFPSRFAQVPFWRKPINPDMLVRDIERLWITGPKSP